MFQPYHGDNNLHFGEHFNDNMMYILYNHYAEFNFSSSSSLEQESTVKHGVPLRQITRLCNVMVSVLSSSVVDYGFDHQSGQTKYYKIGISCFSIKKAHKSCWLWVMVICLSGTPCFDLRLEHLQKNFKGIIWKQWTRTNLILR
jgi:hypothetical protein